MYTRRVFIKRMLGMAACAGLSLWRPLAPASGRAGSATGGLVPMQQRVAMGSLLSISLAGLDGVCASQACDAAFARVAALEKMLSSHDSEAPLAQLSRHGFISNPSQELREVLGMALEHARLSDGAFNPAIKPLLDKLREHTGTEAAELDELRALTDWRAVRMEDDRIALERTGMALTLDAIAKGYIVDQVSNVLCAFGAKNHLINAGGDILARGAKPDGSPWLVGVSDPERFGQFLTVLPLLDSAIATSGNSESLREGYSHLVPPERTLANMLPQSVSVIAPDAATADALATTLAVMPVQQGIQYIETFKAACLISTGQGASIKSHHWPAG